MLKHNNFKFTIIALVVIALLCFTSVAYAEDPINTTPPTISNDLDDSLPTDSTPPTSVPTDEEIAAQEKAKAANQKLDKATQKLLDTQLKIDLTTLQIQETVGKLAALKDQIENNTAKLAINEMPTAQLKKEIQYRAIKLYQDNSGEPADDAAKLYQSRVSQLANSVQGSSTKIFSDYQKRIEELDKVETDLEAQEAQALILQADLETQNAKLAKDFELAKKEYEKQSKTFLDANGLVTARLAIDGKVCPIAGPLTHVDDWGNPRSGGRTHKGNDLFNAKGTPNVAIVAGRTEFLDGGLGGMGIFLHGDDGNIYYYAHLSARAGVPRQVAQGEVIAYTGDTGNATGGAPHTHFEIRLGGTVHVNPYPTLRIICGV